MPPQETGKQKAARIPLDYYKKRDVLHTMQARLGWLALIVPLLWVGVGLVWGDQRDFSSSRGPVAAVHQTWDANCSACHVSFTPISSNSFRVPLIMGEATDSSAKCQTCHAGPNHFHNQPNDRSCGSCHREHGSRFVSLVNLPDSDCTQCHRDIHRHIPTDQKDKKFTTNITQFSKPGGHPPFQSIVTDPGKLKFNHKRHLAAGMPAEKGGKVGDPVMLLGNIPEPFKKRYRDQQVDKADTAPVKLECASCHQLDAGDFGVADKQANDFPFNIAGKRTGGAYMQPIVYENQCQACHPLSLLRKTAGDPKSGEFTVPHRLKPEEIHDLLKNFFTARLAHGETGFLGKKSTRPLPGKLLDQEDRTNIKDEVVRAEMLLYLSKEVERSEKDIYLSKRLCAECHYFEGKAVAEAIKPGTAPDLRIAPTNVPTVWYKHAKFNHTAHRAVKCVDCHAGAETSTEEKQVLIPNMDNCVNCHAPKTSTGGGVRHNCTECHQYHHAEQPWQGVGAARRSPKNLHKIDDFLLVK